MIYSKRGPLWADLVWKSSLLHKCEILEDLHQRLMPEKGYRWETTCQYMWSHATMWHSTIPSAVRAWFDTHSRMMSLFLAPYSPFLKPIEEFFWAWRWKVFDHRPQDQMSLGCNGCWMPRHHSLNNTRKDKAYQKILPKMPCQRRYQVWCGWEHVAKRRGPGRLDYIYLFIFILLWVFLFVYSHNKWQLYCIFFLFSCILVFLMSCFKQNLYCSNSVSVFPPFLKGKISKIHAFTKPNKTKL